MLRKNKRTERKTLNFRESLCENIGSGKKFAALMRGVETSIIIFHRAWRFFLVRFVLLRWCLQRAALFVMDLMRAGKKWWKMMNTIITLHELYFAEKVQVTPIKLFAYDREEILCSFMIYGTFWRNFEPSSSFYYNIISLTFGYY